MRDLLDPLIAPDGEDEIPFDELGEVRFPRRAPDEVELEPTEDHP